MKITVSAIINATAEKVWEVWTNPEHIINWNFASADWHCPSAANDLRSGGKFTARMEAKDGNASFDFEGIYTEVIPYELITYELEDGRPVRITFKESGDRTVITEEFETEDTHIAEQQRAGWQAIMDNFKSYAEGLSS